MLCETNERNGARLLDDHEADSGKRRIGPPGVVITGGRYISPRIPNRTRESMGRQP
jgi:hypothetical protein